MSDHLIAEANRHARSLIIERDQLRTELALLREWQREVIQNANAHHAERKDAIARAETERNNLRADLDAIKAILTEEKARAERAEAELAAERARLKEMAAELAHCAGYIASVRTDRLITWHEELYALQTLEWAEGAFEIAEKANAVLEAHDAAMKEGAK